MMAWARDLGHEGWFGVAEPGFGYEFRRLWFRVQKHV